LIAEKEYNIKDEACIPNMVKANREEKKEHLLNFVNIPSEHLGLLV